MRLEDYEKITLSKFKGLWSRGQADTCPLDYFLAALNVIYNDGEVRTREGLSAGPSLGYANGRVLRFQNIFSTVGPNVITLILDDAGKLYTYSARAGDNATTARLTVAGATDFVAIQMLGKIYIAFSNGLAGLSGVNLKVFIPHATTITSDEFRDAGGAAPSTGLAAADGAASTLMNAGDYQITYCYITTSGHYTIPATPITYTSPGAVKISASSIDNGPSGTAGKQILITKAGETEFFFLPSEFGGVINDNTTTTATLDFDDTTDLVDSADYLFDQLAIIPAPLNLDEYHACLITMGEIAPNDSIIRASRPGEPESFDAVDGVKTISKDDGFTCKASTQLRDILYIHKSLGVRAVQDNGDIPANWYDYPIDESINTGPHGISEFFNMASIKQARDWYLTADKSGIVLNDGSFRKPPVTFAIDDIWQTLNFNYFHKAVLVVDEQKHRIYCAIPRGSSTDNDILLMGDYSVCRGFIPDATTQWAVWELKPGGAVKKPTAIGLAAMVSGTDTVPVLFMGSSDGGAKIWRLDPDETTDDGTAIESYIETSLLLVTEGYVNLFAAVRLRITGTGNLEVTIAGEDSVVTDAICSSSYIRLPKFFGEGLDDLTRSGTYAGGANKDYVIKIVTAAGTDQFQWSDDGGQTFSASTNITGAAQALSSGVSITFAATTGHTLNDYWTIEALNNPIALSTAPGKELLTRFEFQNEKARLKFRLPSGTKFILNKIEIFGTPLYQMRPA